MKKTTIILPIIALLLFAFKPIAPITWKLDTTHSNLGFSIVHLMVSDFKGTVKINSGSIKANGDDFSDATIIMEADISSIDTDNDKRDAHLKSADFFDTDKFPTLSFQSKSFKKESADKYTISGDLTLHGVTKPVTLTGAVKSGINPTNNKPITAFKVTGTIKRSDFDVSAATPVAILSDEVAIEGNLEFGKE